MSTVLVLTGASSGIGASIAKIYLTKPNTFLVAVARSQDKLQKIVDEHGSERVGIVVGDVCDESTVKASIELAVKKFGKVNTVICNAGVLYPVETVDNANIDSWKSSFDVNFFSVVNLAKYAIPELRKTSGNFISVSSGASVGATSGWGCYGASKAALNHLMLTIAEAEQDIKTVSIAPGVVDTPMQGEIREKHSKSMKPESHKRFTDLFKDNKLLPPEVPAKVYVNLALKNDWDSSMNGKYFRYNDESLKPYQ
ncbi:MAG: SDR family NAD(P)-dependent oxidoreductase [Lactococcus lactis]|nr:SDR family NAD(P)-dependent oxidoreductase [Lactococcus lactis]